VNKSGLADELRLGNQFHFFTHKNTAGFKGCIPVESEIGPVDFSLSEKPAFCCPQGSLCTP
jgi:hypothetical protein